MATIKVKKTGYRQFTAGIQFRGQWFLGTGPQTRSAVKALRAKLSEVGADRPDFEVAILATKPAPETPAIRPEPVAEKPAPQPAPQVEDLQILTEDLDEDDSETVPAAEAGTQWVTPWSDKTAYRTEMETAIGGLLSIGIPKTRDSKAEFRKNVSLLMETHGFLGCYRRLPSGESVLGKFFSSFPDPTVRAPKAGDGDRKISKDINGNWVGSEGESLQLKDRPVQKRYFWPGGGFHYVKADQQGKAWKEASLKRGDSAEKAELMYKLGFVVSARLAKRVPHTVFEKDLSSAGYSEERISAIVAEVKNRAAKAA